MAFLLLQKNKRRGIWKATGNQIVLLQILKHFWRAAESVWQLNIGVGDQEISSPSPLLIYSRNLAKLFFPLNLICLKKWVIWQGSYFSLLLQWLNLYLQVTEQTGKSYEGWGSTFCLSKYTHCEYFSSWHQALCKELKCFGTESKVWFLYPKDGVRKDDKINCSNSATFSLFTGLPDHLLIMV